MLILMVYAAQPLSEFCLFALQITPEIAKFKINILFNFTLFTIRTSLNPDELRISFANSPTHRDCN